MSDGQEFYYAVVIPTTPKLFPIRPLDKGMLTNVASQLAPIGSFMDLKGVMCRNGVLERCHGFRRYRTDQGIIPFDLPTVGMHICWDGYTGERDLLWSGSRYLYKVDRSEGVTQIRWTYIPTQSGSVSTPSNGFATLTYPANLSQQNIVVYDELWITVSGETRRFTIVDIQYFANQTVFTFRVPGVQGETIGSGNYSFVVERTIKNLPPYLVDWVVVGGRTYFADDSDRGLIAYDVHSNQLQLVHAAQNPALTQISCVDYFLDRVWIGGMNEEGVDRRNRIRWTSPTDLTTFPALNYVDLQGTDGEIYRLKGLGPVHIAYFTDALFIGRTTNYADLPILYTKMDTGGIGLVGQKALCSWIDGHYFVGQDDIYYLSGSLGLVPIGTPVLKRTIQQSADLSRTVVVPDPQRERIVFAFPASTGGYEELWSFYPKQKAWAYEEVHCDMVGYGGDTTAVYVRDLTLPVGQYTEPVSLWRGGEETRDLFISVNGTLLRESADAPDSDILGAIPVTLESHDIDFDSPDTVKTVTRLSLKIDRVLELGENLQFVVEYSVDRGRTWRSAGSVRMGEGDDEVRVNFLATGSLFRFRIRSSSSIRTYAITEIVLRVRGRGLEVQT